MKEIFKDVPGFEGCYQVSNLGRVKSLKRTINYSDGRKYTYKSVLLKSSLSTSGYLRVDLFKNQKRTGFNIHQLVAIVFLNHNPNGHKLVVNHINFNKLDNKLSNIEIITSRGNTNQKHLKSTSKYTGVSWYKSRNKWLSSIHYKGEKKYLGHYDSEYDAHNAYQNELKKIKNYDRINNKS